MTMLTTEINRYEIADARAREDTGIYGKMRRQAANTLQSQGFKPVGHVVYKVLELGVTYGAVIGVSEADLNDLRQSIKSEFADKGLDAVATVNIAADTEGRHEVDDDEDFE